LVLVPVVVPAAAAVAAVRAAAPPVSAGAALPGRPGLVVPALLRSPVLHAVLAGPDLAAATGPGPAGGLAGLPGVAGRCGRVVQAHLGVARQRHARDGRAPGRQSQEYDPGDDQAVARTAPLLSAALGAAQRVGLVRLPASPCCSGHGAFDSVWGDRGFTARSGVGNDTQGRTVKNRDASRHPRTEGRKPANPDIPAVLLRFRSADVTNATLYITAWRTG